MKLLSLVSSVLLFPAATSLVSVVTGANGYIARAVVQELLSTSSQASADDDEIICLVRSQRVASEKDYWNQYCAANDVSSWLPRVLPYDMVDGGASFRQALATCSPDQERCVYHLASVFGPTEDHKQTALDNVQGTEDLVRVLSEESAPCKLILTSSMAAVRGTGQTPSNGQYYTYQDWNTLSKLGANWGASYQWSKMQSERRAQELCEEYNIPLVVLNPSFVFGPTASSSLGDAASSSYSLTLVGQWARGESQVQSRLYVDVRDVAAAHVAAARRPEAVGKRFLLSTEARVPSQEIAEWLKEACRQNGHEEYIDKIHYDADFDGGAIPIGERELEATDRLREELGVTLRPVKDTIVDMARVLLEETAKA